MARSGCVWLEAKIISDSSSQSSSTSGISCANICGSESMMSFATDAPFTSASKSTTDVSLSAPVASQFPGNDLVVPQNSEASVVNDLQLFRALLLPESERLCEARSTCMFARRQLHDLEEAKGRCGFPRLRYTLDAITADTATIQGLALRCKGPLMKIIVKTFTKCAVRIIRNAAVPSRTNSVNSGCMSRDSRATFNNERPLGHCERRIEMDLTYFTSMNMKYMIWTIIATTHAIKVLE